MALAQGAWVTRRLFQERLGGFCPAVEKYCARHAPPFKELLVLDGALRRPGNLDDLSDDVPVEDLPTDAPALSQLDIHPGPDRHFQSLLSAEGLPLPAGEGWGRRAVQGGAGGAGAVAGRGRVQLDGHLAKARAHLDAGLRASWTMTPSQSAARASAVS